MKLALIFKTIIRYNLIIFINKVMNTIKKISIKLISYQTYVLHSKHFFADQAKTTIQNVSTRFESSISQKPFIKSNRQSSQSLPLISLPLKHVPNQYIVLRNYLIPGPPKPFKKLLSYLSKSDTELSVFQGKQLMYKIKNLDDKKLRQYQKQMQEANIPIQKMKKNYKKVLKKAFNTLPFYYHMLITRTIKPRYQNLGQLQNIFLNELQGDQKKQKTTSVGENQQETKKQKVEIKKYTAKQLFDRVQYINPYIKYKIYQQYDFIHNKYCQANPNFRKLAIRLPILYIKHPYDFYFIEEYLQKQKKGQLKLQTQQQLFIKLSPLELQQRWNNLPLTLKKKYEDAAHNLLIEHQAKMVEITKKTGLNSKRIYRLMQTQFSLQNQKLLDSITLQK